MSRKGTVRSNIRAGTRVAIVLKKDQPTGRRTIGTVKDLLTSSPTHHRGIKVRLTDGQVGRVQEILDGPSADILSAYLIVQDLEGGFLCGSSDPEHSMCFLFTFEAETDPQTACENFAARLGCSGAPSAIFACGQGRPVFHTFQSRSAIDFSRLPAGIHFAWLSGTELQALFHAGRLLEKSREIFGRFQEEFDVRTD